MFMWFVRLLIEALPIFYIRIELLLYLYTMFSKTSYPWASNQYMVHSTAGIKSSTATISVSVELCMFSFCFVEPKIGKNIPIDRTQPVCSLMFQCTDNDPSIQHFSMQLVLALRINGMFLVTLIYFIIWANLDQSKLLGSITLLVRNEIALQVSSLAAW